MIASALRLPSMRHEEERIFLEAMRCLNLWGWECTPARWRVTCPSGPAAFGRNRPSPRHRAAPTPDGRARPPGSNTLERSGLADLIRRIQEMGMTVLVVEHDMTLVMQLAEWVVVLDHGRKLTEGTGDQIRKNREVMAAYLGAEAAYVAGGSAQRAPRQRSGVARCEPDRRRGRDCPAVGSNGAGKSTLLYTIAEVLAPSAGRIIYQDRDLRGMKAERMARLGVSLMPEGRQVFGTLSVIDNLVLGTYVLHVDRGAIC